MMVNGPGVGRMYGTIIDGRSMELQAMRTLTDEQYKEQISKFAVEVKHMDRGEFDVMYELYKDMVHGTTGTKRIKKK